MSETNSGLFEIEADVDNQEKGPQIREISYVSSTSINDLAEYDFIKIFGYFPIKERLVLSHVCHQWKHCVDESFKSEKVLDSKLIDPQFGASNPSNELMALLIQKFHNVRRIDLTGVTFSHPGRTFIKKIEELIETIVSNCLQLESINFGHIYYLDEVFARNAKYFLSLKKIVSENISGEALNCIIGSENLKTIDVNRNDRLINVNFKSLGPKIRELHLIGSNVYKTNTIKDLCEGNGTKIEILSIDIRENEILSLICNNMKKIKELKLCLYLQNCDFKGFANLTDLKSLQVSAKGPFFKNEELTDLLESLKMTKLTELIVEPSTMNEFMVTDDSLQMLQINCPFIEELVIKGFNSLTETGMYSISRMENLKHLDLKCSNINDTDVENVINSCPLRELILHGCEEITNDTVLAFIEKAKESPHEEFFLDVSRTNVRDVKLPHSEDRPKNLKILFETDCKCCYVSTDSQISEDFDTESYEYYDDYNHQIITCITID